MFLLRIWVWFRLTGGHSKVQQVLLGDSKVQQVFISLLRVTEHVSLHRREVKCLTASPSLRCVIGWPQAAQIDTSDSGTLAPKVPLHSQHSQHSDLVHPLTLYAPRVLIRWSLGAAVSHLTHRVGHRRQVVSVQWAPAGLWLPGQPGQTVGHQKVCFTLQSGFRLCFIRSDVVLPAGGASLVLSVSTCVQTEPSFNTRPWLHVFSNYWRFSWCSFSKWGCWCSRTSCWPHPSESKQPCAAACWDQLPAFVSVVLETVYYKLL